MVALVRHTQRTLSLANGCFVREAIVAACSWWERSAAGREAEGVVEGGEIVKNAVGLQMQVELAMVDAHRLSIRQQRRWSACHQEWERSCAVLVIQMRKTVCVLSAQHSRLPQRVGFVALWSERVKRAWSGRQQALGGCG
jgi:hypothetical protein